MHPVAATLNQIGDELNDQFFERGDLTEASKLALCTKQHVFILGTPGTAKSQYARELFKRIEGASHFEAIMSKNRTAEDIIGPYDIPELRDNGHLWRKINGYLPTAHFALLDEIGKMGPTLGHDILAIVNERVFHQVNGGRSSQPVPLMTFFAGSNELMSGDEEAAALWDRMLLRVTVDRIQETGNWIRLLAGESQPPKQPTVLALTDLQDIADNIVPDIKVPRNVLEVMVTLRGQLEEAGIVPSDRRWAQAMHLPRASAFLAGRDEVEVYDLGALRFALWEKPEDVRVVTRLTLSVSDPIAEVALSLMERVEEIRGEIRESLGLADDKRAAVAMQLNRNLAKLTTELGEATQAAQRNGHATKRLEEVSSTIAATKAQVLSEVLGLGQ